MKKIIFAIVGAVLGFPISYFFYPTDFSAFGVSVKINIGDYLSNLDKIIQYGDASRLYASVGICALIGLGIGYLLDNKNKPSE